MKFLVSKIFSIPNKGSKHGYNHKPDFFYRNVDFFFFFFLP